MYFKSIFLIFQILISFTYSELTLEKKDKLLNGFIDFYNNLPNQIYTYEEGILQSADQLDDNSYKIDVNLRVADVHNLDSTKFMKCTATVQDLQDQGVSVANDNYQCQENEQNHPVIKAVHLDKEVETNAGVTSGEKFIAAPREEPGAPCIGCATHISPQAHIEFESADMAMQLAEDALKHIEAKYPQPQKRKVVRIVTLEKQVVAGIQYHLKVEIGTTDCPALSARADCKLVKADSLNTFCSVIVWLRPWTDDPPNYRVTCDYDEAATAEVHHQLQAEHLFNDFLSTYKPEYINNRDEMRRRFDIFKDNVRKMHELNVHERGTATYGVTRFADLTDEEFTTRHLGLKTSLQDSNQVPVSEAIIPDVTLPESFDWRDHGAVTEVKDQGSCGSCWTFSTTGNIEGQWKRHSGKLLSLSEQELVDCDKTDNGCYGGLPLRAYRAIQQLGGLEAETDYPYKGHEGKCAFNKTVAKVQVSGAVNISSNETDMAKWLVQNGPISICLNADAMKHYVKGISHPSKKDCDPFSIDHAVLIVGYGVQDYPQFNKRLPYWIVKNSWGTSWGEKGYYRVYRGDGTCGLNRMATSAVI